MATSRTRYADTRRAQDTGARVTVTIPKFVVEEFDISDKEELLFTVEEDADHAKIRPANP